MNAFQRKENTLVWQYNGETLTLTPWGKNSLRVRAAMMSEVEDTRWALLDPIDSDSAIEISETYASIQNGNIRAVLTIDDWHKYCTIEFYNQHGKTLLRERATGGALALHARQFQPILGGDFRLTASFVGDENEKLYGMGQYQQEILNLKNCSLELAHRNSQASVPFVLSSAGYGFLWHNPAVGRVDFCKNVTQWYAESTKQMDYWICAGDTPAEIEAAYAKATGTVPMMPEYGLGFWQCKLRYWNQEQLLEVAREYNRRNLPIDLIVCDFFHWPKMGDYRFDPEFFPDPKAMVDELNAMGIELMVSVWPQIALDSENYEEMRQKGLLVKSDRGINVGMLFGGASMFFDATNPRAREYVWDKCKRNYYDAGVRVFWLDEAEPEYAVYDFDAYRYALGSNVQIGNTYPQLYSRAFYDGMRTAGQENIVNLVRCAWAGSQRYGALVWSGDIHSDFSTFRSQLCAGLNMGLAGIAWWTTDIGGFSGGDPDDPKFRELLVRWFQWGVFCPVMRLHGDRKPTTMLYGKDNRPALFTGGNNEVWSFGEEVYEILSKYLILREKLRNYTRELMRQAHENGDPLMRTMFYEFPKDEACWTLKDQYMYGPDMLVAPVMWEGATSRMVYLPIGASWTEMATGLTYRGGQSVEATAPIETIPVFLRDRRYAHLAGANA